MRYGGRTNTLDSAMKVLVELDDRFHRLRRQRPGGRTGGFTEQRTFINQRSRDYGSRDTARGDPIEIDVIKPARNGKGNNYKPNQRKCYGCGHIGYIKRNCRSRNKVQRPQLNLIQRLPSPYPLSIDSEEEGLGEDTNSDVSSFTMVSNESQAQTPIDQEEWSEWDYDGGDDWLTPALTVEPLDMDLEDMLE